MTLSMAAANAATPCDGNDTWDNKCTAGSNRCAASNDLCEITISRTSTAHPSAIALINGHPTDYICVEQGQTVVWIEGKVGGDFIVNFPYGTPFADNASTFAGYPTVIDWDEVDDRGGCYSFSIVHRVLGASPASADPKVIVNGTQYHPHGTSEHNQK
jgi:hypothetical protein